MRIVENKDNKLQSMVGLLNSGAVFRVGADRWRRDSGSPIRETQDSILGHHPGACDRVQHQSLPLVPWTDGIFRYIDDRLRVGCGPWCDHRWRRYRQPDVVCRDGHHDLCWLFACIARRNRICARQYPRRARHGRFAAKRD